MTTVAEILKTKSEAQVYGVAPSDSVLKALQLMADKHIGALLVLQDGQIAGIFTERDYARKVVLHGRSSGDTPVREVMTQAVRFVRPEQSAEQCMALMTDNRLLTPADLGLAEADGSPDRTLDELRASVERELIEASLKKYRNNVSATARQLGVSRVTLYRMIDRLKIVL